MGSGGVCLEKVGDASFERSNVPGCALHDGFTGFAHFACGLEIGLLACLLLEVVQGDALTKETTHAG